MDLLIAVINALASGLIALGLLGAILSPKVHDGIVIKVGLISMMLGFGSIAMRLWDGFQGEDLVRIDRALLMICAGVAVVILGYLIRKSRNGHPLTRSTDWTDLP